MNGLRTVTALEHATIVVAEPTDDPALFALPGDAWITEADARLLLAINARRPSFCVRTVGGVKLAQYCGIVRLKTCLLEVLPKFGMAELADTTDVARARTALLRMLHSARALAIARVSAAEQRSVDAPLLDVFVEAFLIDALHQAKRGLVSRYVGHVDDLRVIKGRYLVRQNVLRNTARPHLLHCEYDEFSADNPYNRCVRAALEACRGWIRRASLQRLWLETYARYEGVARVSVDAGDVARLPRDRTLRHYEPLLRWCELLLSLASPALSAGDAPMPGLLFDMNRLFEAHVGQLETTSARDGEIVRLQGPNRALAAHGNDDAFELRPDVTVSLARAPEDIERIVDAKWKRLDPAAANWGVDRGDVHQMLAYAVRYRCRHLELAYPAPDRHSGALTPPVFDIALGDGAQPVQLRVRTVRLWD
ncbi:MAG TPA: hypothetical protein VM555_06390 [Tahibacter sp.]|nr:hypothetical protein [Tahibacter sp.]